MWSSYLSILCLFIISPMRCYQLRTGNMAYTSLDSKVPFSWLIHLVYFPSIWIVIVSISSSVTGIVAVVVSPKKIAHTENSALIPKASITYNLSTSLLGNLADTTYILFLGELRKWSLKSFYCFVVQMRNANWESC